MSRGIGSALLVPPRRRRPGGLPVLLLIFTGSAFATPTPLQAAPLPASPGSRATATGLAAPAELALPPLAAPAAELAGPGATSPVADPDTAPAIAVEIAPDLACPDRAHLAGAIADVVRDQLASFDPPRLSVSVAPGSAPDEVRLQLVAHRVTHSAGPERTIPFDPADCLELPHTIALLARSWLAPGWDRFVVSAGPQRAPLRAEARAGSANRDAPANLPPLTLTALAGAFTGVAPSTSAAPFASATAEWTLSGDPAALRWGLALSAGYDAPLRKATGEGSLAASLATAALLTRASLYLADRSPCLDLLAGPALTVLSARSAGFAESLARDRADVALQAALRVRYPLGSSGLALAAAAGVSIRAHEEVLRTGSPDAPPLLIVGRTRLALALGLAWSPAF